MHRTSFDVRTALVFCFTALFAAIAGAHHNEEKPSRDADYDYDAPVSGTYELPVIKRAADGALVDSNGNATRLSSLTVGKITVLSFIYTRCGDARACPYATSILNQLHQASVEDPALARNLRLVSMSFDPEHDTPKRLAEYASNVRENANGCPWQFVAPRSVSEAAPILNAYDQAVNRKKEARDGMGPLSHNLRVYLIDREGRVRNIYSTGTLDLRLVLADIRTLLLENPNR